MQLFLRGDGATGTVRFLDRDPEGLIPYRAEPYAILETLSSHMGSVSVLNPSHTRPMIRCRVVSLHHGAQASVPSPLLSHLWDAGVVDLIPHPERHADSGILRPQSRVVDGVTLRDGEPVVMYPVYRGGQVAAEVGM